MLVLLITKPRQREEKVTYRSSININELVEREMEEVHEGKEIEWVGIKFFGEKI